MDKKVDISQNAGSFSIKSGCSAAFVAAASAFIYSGRPLFDCASVTIGVTLMALAMINLCFACGFTASASSAAAIMLAFCPYTTELALLNPSLPIIAAGSILCFSVWARALSYTNKSFNAGFLLILLPGLFWAAVFNALASPAFMDLFNAKTYYPLPLTEQPHPAAAYLNSPASAGELTAAVGWLILPAAIAALYKLNTNALIFATTAAAFALPAFDKSIMQIPPGIWLTIPATALMLLAAKGAENIAEFMERRFRVRKFWIISIPPAEAVIITYIMTY